MAGRMRSPRSIRTGDGQQVLFGEKGTEEQDALRSP